MGDVRVRPPAQCVQRMHRGVRWSARMTGFFARNSLSYRLVLLSLLIGSVLSIGSTGVQLLVSYERLRGDATAILNQVETALIDTLELALWTFDQDQIAIILDGIASNDAVANVSLNSETGETWSRGAHSDASIVKDYALVWRAPDDVLRPLGTLHIEVSLDSVNARIWEQFWVSLVTNLTKAYLAAIALFYIVHRLITRHLRNIAIHVDETDVETGLTSLALDRDSRAVPDDLDRIVAAIRSFEQRANTALTDLQREVAERIKSEQEAREALSVRTSFIGTMSHEVRTPLNSIMGFLHLIEIEKDVPQKQRNYAHVATKAARQLLNQLTNVLEMSRLDSKAVTIAKRPTDITRLAEQWQATAAATVHFLGRDIEVTLDLDAGLDPEYLVDGARLTQMVTNLTDNAAKFTQKGEIRIGLRPLPHSGPGPDPKALEISVADTGMGIAPDQRSRIFERFTQSDDGIGRGHGGAGLGLTISREVSALMGAELTLRPEIKDGFSTVFLITLG